MRICESYVSFARRFFVAHTDTRFNVTSTRWILLSEHVTMCVHRIYTHSRKFLEEIEKDVFSKRGEGRSGQRFKLAGWLVEIPICSQFFKRGGSGNEVEEKGIEVETESPWGLRRHYTPRLSADAPKTILNSRKSCEGPLSFANSLPSSRSFRLPLANDAHIIPLPLPPWSFDPPPRSPWATLESGKPRR